MSASTPRSRAPRTSSVSTCRLPPDSRASSARAVADTGPSRARCSSAPSSSGSSGPISMRTRWPSRWRTVRRADGVRPVRTVPTRNTVRDMMSGTSTATEVSSSRSRSSTSSTSRSSPASRRSSARAAWNRPVRSSSPTPSSAVRSAGSRWASAPSGISLRRRVADRPLDRDGRLARRGAAPPRPGASCRPRPGRAARRRPAPDRDSAGPAPRVAPSDRSAATVRSSTIAHPVPPSAHAPLSGECRERPTAVGRPLPPRRQGSRRGDRTLEPSVRSAGPALSVSERRSPGLPATR